MSVPLAANDFDNGQIMIVVTLIVLPIALLAFATVGEALKSLGKGRWAIERELPQSNLRTTTPVSKEVREAEMRQMLEAKSYRRQARGQPPLDIEAELERLLAESSASSSLARDAELRAEVRQLVLARNERRMRQGKSPLDVEEEIEHQLRELENLGQ